jgi:6-phosphogluconolactonase
MPAPAARPLADFAIDPTGSFLLAANQDSDTVVVFRVDREAGALVPVGQPVPVPRPVCVAFAINGRNADDPDNRQ